MSPHLFHNDRFAALRIAAGFTIPELSDFLKKNKKIVKDWENGLKEPENSVLLTLENISLKKKALLKNKGAFTFIDLFAGIGGLRLGFQKAGGKCIFTSEWNKFSQKTYRANFPDGHMINGDITQIHAKEIPLHDMLIAGFPCQPFSIAGVSKKKSLGKEHGFLDKTQGTLFFDVARIIKHHQPVAFLLENVKNLKSHNKGSTFKIIKQTLEELGYFIDYRVIDAKGYVPQHRERIFISGFKRDVGFRLNQISIPDSKQGPKLNTILHSKSDTSEPPYTGEKTLVNEKYTLSDHLWAYLQAYAAKHKAKGNGFGFGLVTPNDKARTLSARYYKDGSEILIKQNGKNPRRLTPRECARLMGFDKPLENDFIIPVSDTQAYKQFGNAVVVPVIEEIAKAMQPYILESINTKATKTG